MLLEDVQNCLRIALTTTIVEEYGLFAASSQRMPPSERAFAAQLAFRLRHIFEDHWDVDVDYNSWPTPGERRTRSRVLEIPSTADLMIHRRASAGRENNLLLLALKMHDTPNLEHEMQHLSGLRSAYEYQHAVVLNLHVAYAATLGRPPAVLLPTWLWIGAETDNSDVYAEHEALEVCRRGNQRHSPSTRPNQFTQNGAELQSETPSTTPATSSGRRVEILPQLHARYGDWVRWDIASVALVQLEDAVLLEVTSAPFTQLDDEVVEQDDMAVLGDNSADGRYLKPTDPIELNVAKFLKLDDLSIIMVTNLIEEEAAQAIADSELTEEEYLDRIANSI
jgi:hypothetical protein